MSTLVSSRLETWGGGCGAHRWDREALDQDARRQGRRFRHVFLVTRAWTHARHPTDELADASAVLPAAGVGHFVSEMLAVLWAGCAPAARHAGTRNGRIDGASINECHCKRSSHARRAPPACRRHSRPGRLVTAAGRDGLRHRGRLGVLHFTPPRFLVLRQLGALASKRSVMSWLQHLCRATRSDEHTTQATWTARHANPGSCAPQPPYKHSK